MPTTKTKKSKFKGGSKYVTGNFEMHYEDLIVRNRFVVIAVVALTILSIASFVPIAVERSVAEMTVTAIEPEQEASATDLINIHQDDPTASGGSYIEFLGPK